MPGLGKLARYAGTALGGLGGASMADEEDDVLLHALGGAAIGGGAIPGMAGAVLKQGSIPEKLRDYTYLSFLSSPDTAIRASMGAIGGALTGASDIALDALFSRNSWEDKITQLGKARDVVTSLLGSTGDYFKLMNDPDALAKLYREEMPHLMGTTAEQHGLDPTGRSKGLLGRLYAVPDLLAVRAMKKGGFSAEEAARYTLSGDPASKLGEKAMELREGFRENPWGAVITDQLAPFARVGVMGLEKGTERIPGLGPLLHGRNPLGREDIRRQLQGGAAGLAGYYGEDGSDPRVLETLGPLAGPAYLPFSFGRNYRDEIQSGDDWLTAVQGALTETAKEMSPLGATPGAIVMREGEVARRLVPAGVGDVAEMLDPEEYRETGPQRIAELQRLGEQDPLTLSLLGEAGPISTAVTAQMPFLREELPAGTIPVDVFGERRAEPLQSLTSFSFEEDSLAALPETLQTILTKTVFPSRERLLDPALNVETPLVRELLEMGITPAVPSPQLASGIPGVPVSHTPESAAAVRGARGHAQRLAAEQITNPMAPDPRVRQLHGMPAGPAKVQAARTLFEQIRRQVQQTLIQAGLMPPLQDTAEAAGAGLPEWFLDSLR
jgi:hypothetical protein